MSNAFNAMGTKLQKGDAASPEVFATVAEVLSISWGGKKLDMTDVTNMDSVGGYEEVLPTIFRSGEITFDVNYVPAAATQIALNTDYEARTKRNWKIVLPGSPTIGTWSFSGYIAELGLDLPLDKQAKRQIKIKVTGQPTFA